jgi:predicted Rossmann-fold nucleotide-binding protein
VIAPGGFGTLDELFEALTLIQTATIEHFPVILLGEGEWDGLLEWLAARALPDHRIDRAELAGLRVATSPQDVVELVATARERQQTHARRLRRRATGP